MGVKVEMTKIRCIQCKNDIDLKDIHTAPLIEEGEMPDITSPFVCECYDGQYAFTEEQVDIFKTIGLLFSGKGDEDDENES